jgi:hypothetical protein
MNAEELRDTARALSEILDKDRKGAIICIVQGHEDQDGALSCGCISFTNVPEESREHLLATIINMANTCVAQYAGEHGERAGVEMLSRVAMRVASMAVLPPTDSRTVAIFSNRKGGQDA